MKAPSRKVNGYHWTPPDLEWLEYHYVLLEKSAQQIARETGSVGKTVTHWLRGVGLEVRKERLLVCLSSAGSRARRLMRSMDVPRVCVWCGCMDELEVHHKDHDPFNSVPENLAFLCRACHRFETGLWHLLKQGKIDLTCNKDRTMVIRFK